MTRPSRLLLVPSAVALAALLVGCGSDGSSDASAEASTTPTPTPTATTTPATGAEVEAVCSAYQGASSSLSALKNDLKDRNFGNARTSLSQAGDDLDALVAAVQDLSAGVRDAVKPRAQEIADQVDALDAATSVEQLKAGLSIIEMEARQLATDITTNLSC